MRRTAKMIGLVLFMLMLFASGMALAQNETNATFTNTSTNVTPSLNKTVLLNNTFADRVENSMTEDAAAPNATTNTTAANETLNATSPYIFEIIVENATITDEGITFAGEIMTMLETANATTPIYSAVELDIYSYEGNATDLDICTYYVNGTTSFNCTAPDADDYAFVAITDYANKTYYRYATFNRTDVSDELVIIDKRNSTDGSGETAQGITDVEVRFREGYMNQNINGTIILDYGNNDGEGNTSAEVLVEVWPYNNTARRYDERQNCSLTMTGEREDFICPVTFMASGTYMVNVSVYDNETQHHFEEITYFKAPEFKVRLQHEGVYRIGETVDIRGYATLDNTEVEVPIALHVLTPANETYEIEEMSPQITFAASDAGDYDVRLWSFFRGKNYTLSSPVIVATPEQFEEMKETAVRTEVSDVYEVDEVITVPVTVAHRKDHERFARISITEPDQAELDMVAEIRNESAEIAYWATKPGRYTIKVGINNSNASSVMGGFTVLDKQTYARDVVLEPLLHTNATPARFRGRRPVEILDLRYDENSSRYSMDFKIGNASRARLRNISSVRNITYVTGAEINISGIRTEVFAIDADVTDAEIVLAKRRGQDEGSTEYIMRCEEWNASSLVCADWEQTSINFEENATHIAFNVTHFTAYAGGGGNDSELWIWDEGDSDKDNRTLYADELVNITANYTDNLTGDAIVTASCIAEIDGSLRTMSYGDGIYWANVSLASRGVYEYNVTCSDPSYDDLSATDNMTIYESVNASQMTLGRNNITLGYATTASCRVIDAQDGNDLDSYPVDFYSDKDGYLGTQTTDLLGWSSISFTPESDGEHAITCNISEHDYYLPSAQDAQNDVLDVYLSQLEVEKDVIYAGARTFNITLKVENAGQSELFDLTVADYVPEGFRPEFTIDPDWNSTTALGGGLLHYWNITNMPGASYIMIRYTLAAEEGTNVQHIEDSYIMGETYQIH